MIRTAVAVAVGVALVGTVAAAPAWAAKKSAGAKADGEALTVTVAQTIVPAPELLAMARQLRDAAAAKDAAAVAALIADEVTVVVMPADLGSEPKVTKEGPYTAAADLVAVVGRNVGSDGDFPPGASKEKIDEIIQRRAFAHIVASIDGAEWGRDPRVKGGFCTYRGRIWSAAAVKTLAKGVTPATGGTVDRPTPVRVSGDARAAFVGTLAPGRLYLDATDAGSGNGWRAVRLPTGKVGYVEAEAWKPIARTGICFLPNVDGGWLMSAVAGIGP